MKKEAQDIKELDERIRSFKAKQEKKENKHTNSSWRNSLANAFRIGTEFVAAVAVGICLGYTFDKIFGTKVIFLLVFSLFGCMAGMLNVYRSAQEMDKNLQKEKD